MRLMKFEGRVVFVLSMILPPGSVLAGDPTAQLKGTIDDFVKILASTPVSELQATGLPESALKLIFARFDFSEMTKRTLGTHWTALNQNEQTDFVNAFTQRLLILYGRTVRTSGNEKVLFTNETLDGTQASVATTVISSPGDETPIDYRLHDVGGQWRVYDVVIDHVSMVNNFRAQFDRVIAKTSVKELLKKLQEQNQQS